MLKAQTDYMNGPVKRVSFAECYLEIHLRREKKKKKIRITLFTLVKCLYLGLKCVYNLLSENNLLLLYPLENKGCSVF